MNGLRLFTGSAMKLSPARSAYFLCSSRPASCRIYRNNAQPVLSKPYYTDSDLTSKRNLSGQSLVDSSPSRIQPYLRLMRLDRPIGESAQLTSI